MSALDTLNKSPLFAKVMLGERTQAAALDADHVAAEKSRTRLYAVDQSHIQIIEGLNARQNYGDLDELAQSLIAQHKATGQALINPLILRGRKGEPVNDLFAGHRRVKAAALAKEKYDYDVGPLLARVFQYNTALAVMLAMNSRENHQKPLEPIEEAIEFNRYKEGGLTLEQIGEITGRSTCHVSKRINLLKGDESVIEATAAGQLQAQTAAEIVTRHKDNPEKQRELVKRATSSKEGAKAVREELKADMNAKGKRQRKKIAAKTGKQSPKDLATRLTQDEVNQLAKSHSAWAAAFVQDYGVALDRDAVANKFDLMLDQNKDKEAFAMAAEFGKIEGVGLALGL